MKKTIQATSKRHEWFCGAFFVVEKFVDAGKRTRFQIVCSRSKVLISKRAIKAMANDEYRREHVPEIWRVREPDWYYLRVCSPFGEIVGGSNHKQVVSIAKCIMKELKIK